MGKKFVVPGSWFLVAVSGGWAGGWLGWVAVSFSGSSAESVGEHPGTPASQVSPDPFLGLLSPRRELERRSGGGGSKEGDGWAGSGVDAGDWGLRMIADFN